MDCSAHTVCTNTVCPHKAQGKTLQGAVVVTRHVTTDERVQENASMQTQPFYVGCSRVRNAQQLKIYPNLPHLTKPSREQKLVTR